MPNHVEQDITISGSPTTLQEFMDFAKEEDYLLSANKFIPYPEEFKRMDLEAKAIMLAYHEGKGSGLAPINVKDGFNSGGYQWCIQNWGTKWGIYDAALLSQKLTGKTGKLKYTCQSAWSPCLPIVDAMSKKFPDLKFDMRYYEGGMGFKGHYVVKNGEILTNEESKYQGRRGG
jgi:Api92-like protein with ferredoxin domain